MDRSVTLVTVATGSFRGAETRYMLHRRARGQGIATRIAVVQQNHNPGNVEENRAKAVRSAAQAVERGADVVLFHEELLAGYVQDPRLLAEPADGITTRQFQQALRGSRARVIYGLAEKDGPDYYIAALIVGSEGIVGRYRKTHLWWDAPGARYEPGFYRPGDCWTTFDLAGFQAGVMICYDGDFPETTRSYANLGCVILFWMNNRGSRGYEEVRERARLNSIIVATSCCCGLDERNEPCRGGSNIVDATGRLLAEIWDTEGIIYADVRPEEVLALRQKNPWFVGQRRDLYC